MSDYNEGDLVEAVKGETVIRGRLVHLPKNGLVLKLTLALTSDILHLKANGYKVRTVKRAIPKAVLPTEPGLYISEGMFEFGTEAPLLYWLNRELQWSVLWHNAPAENRTARQMIDGTSGAPLVQMGLVGK